MASLDMGRPDLVLEQDSMRPCLQRDSLVERQRKGFQEPPEEGP